MQTSKYSKLLIASALAISLTACGQKTSEESVASANNFIQSGKPDSAIIELKNAVQQAPNDADVRVMLGTVYLQTGQLAAAGKEIQRALDLGADVDANVPVLAKIKYYNDQFDSVVSLADKYALSEPSSISTLSFYKLLSLYRSEVKLRNEEDKEKLLASMNDEHKQVAEAFVMVEKGELVQVKLLIDSIDKQSLLSNELAFVQGLVALREGDNEVAANAFNRINTQIPSLNSIDFLETTALLKAKNYAQAEIKANQLYAKAQENPLVNLFKAMIEFDRENYKDAFLFANKASQYGLNSDTCLIILAVSAYQLENLELAYSHLSALNNRNGIKNELVQRLFANVQLRLGYGSGAAQSLDNLSNIELADAELLAMTGLNLAYKGDIEKAKKLLRQANLADDENVPNQIREALLYAGNDEEQVISSLTKVLETDPNVSQAWMQLAVSYVRNGDMESALKVADEWAEISEADGMSLKGVVYMQSDYFKEAIESFQNTLSLNPKHSGARLFLLQSFEETENHSALYDSATKFLADDPANEPILLALLRAANKLERLDSAILHIREISKNNPEQVEPRVALAMGMYFKNDFAAVVEILAASRENLTPLGYMTLGDSYIRMGDHPAAMEVFEEWNEANYSSTSPTLRILGLYELAGEHQKALQIAEKAVEKFGSSNSNELNLLRVNYLTKLQRLDEAEALFAKIRNKVKENLTAKLYEGQLALYKKEFVKAENLLSEYYAVKPNFNIAFLLARAMLGNTHVDEAAAILEAELARFEHPTLQMQSIVADFYIYNKMFSRAEEIYQNMISIDGNNPAYLNNLAVIKQSLNKLDEASNMAEKALELEAENPYFMDTLGYIEYQKGDLDKAYEYLSQAAKMLPKIVDVQLNYSELLIGMEWKDKAKTTLDKLKTATPEQKKRKSELLAMLR